MAYFPFISSITLILKTFVAVAVPSTDLDTREWPFFFCLIDGLRTRGGMRPSPFQLLAPCLPAQLPSGPMELASHLLASISTASPEDIVHLPGAAEEDGRTFLTQGPSAMPAPLWRHGPPPHVGSDTSHGILGYGGHPQRPANMPYGVKPRIGLRPLRPRPKLRQGILKRACVRLYEHSTDMAATAEAAAVPHCCLHLLRVQPRDKAPNHPKSLATLLPDTTLILWVRKILLASQRWKAPAKSTPHLKYLAVENSLVIRWE